MEFKIGDIYNDSAILTKASEAADEILALDPELDLEQHRFRKNVWEVMSKRGGKHQFVKENLQNCWKRAILVP